MEIIPLFQVNPCCQLAQNHPTSQFLFHKNCPTRNLFIMTLVESNWPASGFRKLFIHILQSQDTIFLFSTSLATMSENVNCDFNHGGRSFTYVTKTRANLATYSRKPGNYNGTIIFEIDIMKKSYPINLKLAFLHLSKPKHHFFSGAIS